MSRSLHTDPYALRAARRIVAPYRRRADEPRVARRWARLGRRPSAAACAAADSAGGPPTLIDVRVCPPRPEFLHPASADDVARSLAFFGPAVVYGLHRVELRKASAITGPGCLSPGCRCPVWSYCSNSPGRPG